LLKFPEILNFRKMYNSSYISAPSTMHDTQLHLIEVNANIPLVRRFHTDSKVLACELIPFIGILSRHGLNPIQLAYDPRCRKAGS